MRLFKDLQSVVVLGMFISVCPNAFCQIEMYQVTGGISASAQGWIVDVGNSTFDQPATLGPGAQGFAPISLGTFTDTIYLDPTALTVRQVAVFSPSGPSTVVMNETHSVSGQNVLGTLTVSQGLAGGGLTLDTGTERVVWNSSLNAYTYLNASLKPTISGINIAATYSLVTGGQTYTGNWGYQLAAFSGIPNPSLFTTFSQSPDQLSLTLDGVTDYNNSVLGANPANLTAADGFQMDLIAGDDGDKLQELGWNGTTSTATLVPETPEPGAYALLGMGLAGLVYFRRGRVAASRR